MGGGKDPPRFTPSRSALDESFTWRPAVNKEYGINIPIYRRLNGKLDSPENCSRNGRRVRAKNHSQNRPTVQFIGESWKGDIAYYFKKARYAYIDEETEEELDTGVEEFESGDVVAILSDGSVTRNTSDPDTQFLSVIPGSVSDQLSPWKTLPDPVPEPIEDYQLVSLLGMVYVRIKDSSALKETSTSKIRKHYVIYPSGDNDGFGILGKKKDSCPVCLKTGCNHAVAVPFDTLVPQDYNGRGDLVLCLRSGDTVRPLLETLRETNNSLASLKEEQQNEMDKLSDQVKQLGLDFQEHLKVDAEEGPDHSKTYIVEVPSAKNDTTKNVNIPSNIEHVQLFPYPPQQEVSHDECIMLSSTLKIHGCINILENDHGKMIALEPYYSSFYAQHPTKAKTIEGAILFDLIGENLECRTYCFQKRHPFRVSDIKLLLDGEYIHSVNGIFSEIFVEDRFILRIMRVVRKTDVQKFLPIIAIPQLYRNIHKDLSTYSTIGGILSDLAENGSTVLEKPSPSEETSFKQMLKNGQWDDVCLYVTSHKYSPILLQNLPTSTLTKIKRGLDELLRTKYKSETENNESVSVLIKDRFFPPLNDNDSLVMQIKLLACFYVTLLPASEKTLTLLRMNAITVAIKDNPVMCIKWASKNNIRVIGKFIGWDYSAKKGKFPNTQLARAAIRIINCLLNFSCVIRKLGNEVKPIISTAFSIIENHTEDAEVNSMAYSIILSFTKDPFSRTYSGSFPQMQALLQDSLEYNEKYKPLVERIKLLMRQIFFTNMCVEEDIRASVPFCVKLPYATPSGRDRMWDTFLILHFNTPRPQKDIKFWVKVPLPCPLP